MRIFFILFFISIIHSLVFADTVLIRKSDGFPIEYQSGDILVEVLLENNPSYTKDEVEIKKISREEYDKLYFEKIIKVEKEKNDKGLKEKKDRIKQKLNLSDSDITDLKGALSD